MVLKVIGLDIVGDRARLGGVIDQSLPERVPPGVQYGAAHRVVRIEHRRPEGPIEGGIVQVVGNGQIERREDAFDRVGGLDPGKSLLK